MTLVEFFSKNPIENIMGTLFFKPKKTVFVGFENSISGDDKKSIKKYIKLKNTGTDIEFVNIAKHSFKCAVNVLSDICEKNEECVFDFTGGEELILAAMGYIMAKNKICAVETNPFKNLVYANLQEDALPILSDDSNTINENFVMCGGIVDKSKLKPEKQYLSEKSYYELAGLWNICRQNTSLWNSTCIALNSLQDSYFPKEKENSIFKRLVREKFIIIKNETNKSYDISFKNKITQLCLMDPGTILELYTYHSLKNSGRYNEVKVGVSVDWDGYFHSYSEKAMDTSNEIDVVAMKGLRPVYISCKNGKVSKETLYELETVSNRFGGVYAAKVLVAPMLKSETMSNQYIKNRAADMGITVITDVCSISEKQFVEQIEEALITEEEKNESN